MKGSVSILFHALGLLAFGCTQEHASTNEQLPIISDTIEPRKGDSLAKMLRDSLVFYSDGSYSNGEFTSYPSISDGLVKNLSLESSRLPQVVTAFADSVLQSYIAAYDGYISNKQNYFVHNQSAFVSPSGIRMFQIGWRLKAEQNYETEKAVSFTLLGIYDKDVIFSTMVNDAIGQGMVNLLGVEKLGNEYTIYGEYESLYAKEFGAFKMVCEDGMIYVKEFEYRMNPK